MKKDNSRPASIQIDGHYVSEIASPVTVHRIYHYQVRIDRGSDGPPQQYDRELHLCENLPVQTAEANEEGIDVNTPLAPAEETRRVEIESHTSPARLKTPPPDIPEQEPTPSQQPSLNPPEVETEPGPTAETIDTLSPIDASPDKETAPTLIIQAQPTKPGKTGSKQRGMMQGKSTSFEVLKGNLSRILKKFRRTLRIDLSKFKYRHSRPQRIFNTAVLVFCIVTLASVVYYFSTLNADETPGANKSGPPLTHSPSPEAQEDYHAVIEKTNDGVVITLQGPGHEEVLTKLPPGYDPVVEDNKIVHIVTPGNTLWFIAKRYIKNPYRYPELARLNQIENPDLIYPGDKVLIQYIRKP